MIKTLKGFNRDQRVTLKIISADPLIKLKKYVDTFTSLGAGIDKNGNPVTGLTEDVRDGIKVVTKGTRIPMEKELDLVEGSLKPKSVYWVTYNIRIGTDDIILDLLDPHDLMKYLFCHAQSNVANSIEDIDNNSKAEYVLFSAEQEAKVKVEARTFLKRAYILSDKLDLETKINLCNVYGLVVDATEINTIENKINEELERNPELFLKMADDENLVFRSLLTQALDKGIFDIKAGAVMHGDITVGYDKEEASKALSKDKKLTAIVKAKLTGDLDLIKEALVSK